MARSVYIVCLALLVALIAGCGSVTKSIMAKQDWSENYARAKDAKATSPLMIDGDASTMAETQPSTDVSGASKFTEAVVTLPEQKSIRRIIIKSPNLRNFIVYAGGAKEDDWKTLKEFKNNEETVIDMNVSANTNRIKVRILRTSDDTTVPGGRGAQAQLKHAPGKIQEIELYGLAPAATESAQATASAVAGGTASGGSADAVTAAPAPEKPKAPTAAATLEVSAKSFAAGAPIPIKLNINIGPDELIVLSDHVSNEMLATKFTVTTADGKKIACSKPAPPLSRPMPKRFGDRPVDVRDASTLSPNSVIKLDIPNLLDYYPIKDPGNYSIQFDMLFEIHDKFVGREQTQKQDIEQRISEINARSTYTATEKADLIQNLKDEMSQQQKTKAKRYIEVGAKGKPYELKSNVLEITIE